MTRTAIVTEAAKNKNYNLEDIVPPSLIELLKAAPQNETARAALLAHLKIPLPPEAQSFDQIRQWVEFDYVKPSSVNLSAHNTRAQGRRRAPDEAFTIQVESSEDEYGSCSYSCTRYGSEYRPVTADEITDCAGDAQTLDRFKENLVTMFEENLSDNPVECDDGDNYVHNDYEPSDSSNREDTWNQQRLFDMAVDWLINHRPDEYNRLIGERTTE